MNSRLSHFRLMVEFVGKKSYEGVFEMEDGQLFTDEDVLLEGSVKVRCLR